jgi:hypothetical protein
LANWPKKKMLRIFFHSFDWWTGLCFFSKLKSLNICCSLHLKSYLLLRSNGEESPRIRTNKRNENLDWCPFLAPERAPPEPVLQRKPPRIQRWARLIWQMFDSCP